MAKICPICGKSFTPIKYESICTDKHTRKCVICGEEFELNTYNYRKKVTCGKDKCYIEYNNQKYADAPNSRPGKYQRVCELCGEEFRTNSETRSICYKIHQRSCVICGKEFDFDYDHRKSITCSSKCAAEKRARDLYETRGVRSTFALPEVKEKIKQTNLRKFGVENPLQSPEIRKQIKQTCLEKYGVECATQSESMKAKSKQTNLRKYGVEHAMQNSEIQQRALKTTYERYGEDLTAIKEARKKTCLEKYGTEWYVQSDDFHEKQTKTWNEKYGGNPWSTEEIRKKCNETNLEKYGDIWPQRTDEVKKKNLATFIGHRAESIEDPKVREEYLKFKQDPQKYIQEQLDTNDIIGVQGISDKVGYTDPTLMYGLFEKYGLQPNNKVTQMEYEVIEFIRSLDPNIDIHIHDRSIIHPKEIDIYLPEYKLGIECNPTVTHNSSLSFGQIANYSDSSEDVPLEANYHILKTQCCEKAGVFLFHLFGYEWKSKPETMKSMLSNLLGKNTQKFYGRNLEVKEFKYSEVSEFLDHNHRQGGTVSSINLGLVTKEGKLVSVMTFGKTRKMMGKTKEDDENSYELIRFCNLKNTSVVGGASKLFKYFCKNYKFSKIISFSDRAHTKGKLYETLGFEQVSTSAPNYVWANPWTEFYLTRMACQKQNLRKLFKDETLDIENKTEEQIMVEHKFVKVYDSGNIRWEYNSQNR